MSEALLPCLLGRASVVFSLMLAKASRQVSADPRGNSDLRCGSAMPRRGCPQTGSHEHLRSGAGEETSAKSRAQLQDQEAPRVLVGKDRSRSKPVKHLSFRSPRIESTAWRMSPSSMLQPNLFKCSSPWAASEAG